MNTQRAICAALVAAALVAGAGSCRDFRGAYDQCVADGTCVPADGGKTPGEDASTDAGGDAGEDAGVDAGHDAGYLPHSRTHGESCEKIEDCVLGDFCTDNVCCDVDACDPCQACNVSGLEGSCANVPRGTDPHDACTADVSTCQGASCNGAGSCAVDDGTLCGGASCNAGTLTLNTCAGGSCMPNQFTCPTECADSGTACEDACDPVDGGGCDAGQYCEPGTFECRDYLPLGAPCEAAEGLCAPGAFCTDGVCCQSESCSAPCNACNVSGQEGHCANVPANSAPTNDNAFCPNDPMGCGTGVCDGLGACKMLDGGEPCGMGTYCNGFDEVARDFCGPDGACTTTFTSCDAGTVCDSTSSNAACVWNGLPPGSSCSDGLECASPFACVAGICCGTACGTCEVCDPTTSYSSCIADTTSSQCVDAGTGWDAGTDAGSGWDAGSGSDGGPSTDGGLHPCPDAGFDGGPMTGCGGG